MWQEIIVAVCGILAGAFVLRRYWPRGKTGGSACGGCSGCGGSTRQCKSG